jgi:hypothetical protein
MEFVAGVGGIFGSLVCFSVGIRWKDDIWHRRRERGERLLLIALGLFAISAILLAWDGLSGSGILAQLLTGRLFR